MYAEIVVLTYQPPHIPTYTYKIPEELGKKIKVGQLVSVPFGKRAPMGIIISTRSHLEQGETLSTFEIKPISAIPLPIPLLLPYQIELLKWMEFYYHAPMVNCLEAMLPKLPSAKRLTTNANQSGIKRSASGVGQTIILVPSINHIPQTLAQYPQAKNYAIYHNELKPSERFTVWQKILSGKTDYIFGTRSAIFTPCPSLSEIIIYDEHDNAYKDERSPYFDTLTVAEKIQELTDCKIKIIDSSPRITTYFESSRNKLSYFESSRNKLSFLMRSNLARDSARFDLGGEKPKVKIVNMLDERRAGNRSPLSQILEEYIKRGLERNKKILLFLNKKSESGHVYCRNCRYSDFAPVQPDSCPNCRSLDLWFSSTNVSSLAALVKKIVPSARTNLLIKSGQTSGFRPALQGRTLYAKNNLIGRDAHTQIDIATAAVFYKLLVKKYDLVAHIQTDSLLNITDYTSAEKLFAQITSLMKITKGLLLLQTYNPQNFTIVAASTGNWQKFFQDQLSQRKALSYPPFSLLVKLAIKGKREENLEEKAQKLYQDLATQLSNYPTTQLIKILGPFKSIAGKTPKYNIILKIPVAGYWLKDRGKAVSSISPLISTIPRDWQVEVEPDSII